MSGVGKIDGGHVRLTGHIKTTDPWAAYAEYLASSRRHFQPPYADLLGLRNDILFKTASREGFDLTLKSKQAIEAWCSKFGLLGLLPHLGREIALSPHWREDSREIVDDHGGRLAGIGGRAQVVYRREGGLWISEERWLDADVNEKSPEIAIAGPTDYVDQPDGGELLDAQWDEKGRPRDEALMTMLGAADSYRQPLADAVARYFPDIPPGEERTYDYPIPLSERFWKCYAEPVEEFARAVKFFADSVQLAGSRDKAKAHSGLCRLHALIGPITEMPPTQSRPNRRDGAQPVVVGSLLAAFARMAYQDLRGGARAIICAGCQTVFVSSHYQSRFCSSKCRWKTLKQRQRSKVTRRRKRNG